MYNKNHWQYKGLVKWMLLNDLSNGIIRDSITKRIGRYDSTENKFVNTDLPIGKNGRTIFSFGHYNGIDIRNDYCNIADSATYSFWIKTKLTNDGILLYHNNALTGTLIKFSLNLAISNTIRLEIGPYLLDVTPVISLKNDKWHNIIITLDQNGFYAYVDGVLSGSYIATTNLTNWTNNFTQILSGANGTDGIYMYDFRIYNYAWSSGNISKYYNSIAERNALFRNERAFKYIPTIETITNSTPLTISGPLLLENGLNFNIFNRDTHNSNCDIYISGSPGFIDNNTTLHINGPVSSETSLYINGYDILFNSAFLYTCGHDVLSTNIPQFIYASDTKESGITFSINGHIPLYDSLTSYICGKSVSSSAMNMYVDSDGNPHDDGLDMFLWASPSGTVGVYNGAYLTINNTQTTDPRNGINFFIRPSNELKSASINMVVGNTENHKNLQTTFYIHGPDGILNSGMPMYINTPVGTTGTVPFDGGLNMFINRPINNYAANVPMYLKTNEETSIGTTTFINGANIVTDSNKLYIEGSGVPTNLNNNTIIFVRGGE